MEKRDRALLTVIEDDLVGDSVPTSSILRKCILLGGRTGSTALTDWARGELDGYDLGAELPHYRKIQAVIQGDFQNGPHIVRNHVMGPEDLPDVVREAGYDNDIELRQSLTELESMVSGKPDGSLSFTRPGASQCVKLMNAELDEPFAAVLGIRWTVTTPAIAGVVGRVRTSLAELIAEMARELPPDEEEPTKTAADNAVHLVVTGNRRSTINLVTNGAVTGDGSSSSSLDQNGDPEPKGFFARWRKRGIVVGIMTVVGAAVTTAAWVGWTPWT